MFKDSTRVLFVALCIAVAGTCAPAATIHVPSEQATIQAGINAATTGDTVLVECGTYSEHDIQMKSGITLRSETGEASCVEINALGGRGFYCQLLSDATHIEGFTVTGGSATDGGAMYCEDYCEPVISECTFISNAATNDGGAIFCHHYASPRLVDCEINENSALADGGGMACYAFSNPVLEGCVFSGNSANNGGAIYCTNRSSPSLTGCTLSGNTASADRGGGLYSSDNSCPTASECMFSDNMARHGAGLNCYGGTFLLEHCTFSGNSAEREGGGVRSHSSVGTLEYCTLIENSAQHGGALYCGPFSDLQLRNLTMSANSAPSGGSVHCYEATLLIENTIIHQSILGSAVDCYGSSPVPFLSCCDLYANEGGDWEDCIAGQDTLRNNFSADPMFCLGAVPEYPYSVEERSPCVPGWGPCTQLVGAWEPMCPSAAGEMSWGRLKSLYR